MKEFARGWLVRVLFLIAPFEFKLSVRLSARGKEKERERGRKNHRLLDVSSLHVLFLDNSRQTWVDIDSTSELSRWRNRVPVPDVSFKILLRSVSRRGREIINADMHFPLSRGRGGKEGRKKKIVVIQTVAIRIRASGIGAGRENRIFLFPSRFSNRRTRWSRFLRGC